MFRRALALFLLFILAPHPLLPESQAARRARRGAVVSPVRLVPDGDVALSVQGLHSYFGQIQLRAASDGLVVVNRLPLERYLLGLNEVPTDWPFEALRAQAVAARTYALWTLEQPRGGSAATYGFDICASVECQVFSGADVVRLSSHGERWARAVQDTAGTAILYRGEPILARYHSTSGGRTLDNEMVFTSEGPFPYLKSVDSVTEEGSSVYRWRVTFSLRRAEAILERAGAWPRRKGRLRSVSSIASSAGYHYPDLLFTGSRGRSRMTADEFRSIVRTYAPQMYPGRYPSRAPTSSGRLPETLPSNRLTAETTGGRIEIVGRGWGHGVGMSQWGAEGLARRGAGFREILQHYYTGVTVESYPDPGAVEVGVGWARREVKVTGSFDVTDGRGRTLVKQALGTWTFTFAGTGAVSVKPPHGHGLPLEVGIVGDVPAAEAGTLVRIPIALAAPAKVTVRTEGGERGDVVVRDAGRTHVGWRAPAEPGTYSVVVVAKGRDRTRSDTVSVEVTAPEPEPVATLAAREGTEDEGRPVLPGGWGLLALLAGFIAAIFALWKVTMGR